MSSPRGGTTRQTTDNHFASSSSSVSSSAPRQVEGRPFRMLQWDENNHWSVMTKIYGSVMPSTVPYCVANGLLTALLYELKQRQIVDLTTSASGHKYLAIIMSFLLVTRVKIIYDRYMHSAASLANVYKACREIVQWTCVFSAADDSPRAQQWRHDVAYAVIVMLRVTVSVLEFESDPAQLPWALADIDHQDGGGGGARNNQSLSSSSSPDDVRDSLFASFFRMPPDHHNHQSDHNDAQAPSSLLAHTAAEERTLLEEACRAPIVLALNVRQAILKQRDGTWLKDRSKVFYHPCNEEMRLLDYVGDFLQNFHHLRKLIVTPLPFPLVNMAKIFLFLWVFTVPCAICHFSFQGGVIVPVLIIVLITTGFVGLEYVSIELSDPFGDDPSDFDDLAMAQITFEDIYLTILRCDGLEWSQKLRDRVVPRTALEEFRYRYAQNFSVHGHLSTTRHKTLPRQKGV